MTFQVFVLTALFLFGCNSSSEEPNTKSSLHTEDLAFGICISSISSGALSACDSYTVSGVDAKAALAAIKGSCKTSAYIQQAWMTKSDCPTADRGVGCKFQPIPIGALNARSTQTIWYYKAGNASADPRNPPSICVTKQDGKSAEILTP